MLTDFLIVLLQVSAQFFDEQIIVHAIRAKDTHPFIGKPKAMPLTIT